MKGGAEFEVPIHPVEVHKHCDKDGCHGEMVSTGEGMGGAYGVSWFHRCSTCNERTSFTKSYPCVEYRGGYAPTLSGQPI